MRLNGKNQFMDVNPQPSVTYHPGLCASHINVPLLMVISPDDEVAGAEAEISRLVFNEVQGPKEWHEIEGCILDFYITRVQFLIKRVKHK